MPFNEIIHLNHHTMIDNMNPMDSIHNMNPTDSIDNHHTGIDNMNHTDSIDNMNHTYSIDNMNHTDSIDNHHHHINDLSYDDRYRAILSDISYAGPSKCSDTLSYERIEEAINQAKIDHPEYADRLSNLKILESNYDSVFLKDTNTNTCYLSARGTDPTLGQSTLSRDLLNDMQIAKGLNPHRMISIDNLLNKEISLNSNCKWEAVGHSLGGRIVEELGIKHPDVKVTSFEPGYQPGDMSHLNDRYDNITSHKIIGDVITMGASPGETVYHKVDFYGNPLDYHSLDNYIF